MGRPVLFGQLTSLSAAAGLNIPNGSVTGATNREGQEIVITAASHGLADGDQVRIASVLGNTNANGDWRIDVLTVNTFKLRGAFGNANYTTGGTWKKTYFGKVFAMLQAETQNVRIRDDGTDPTTGVGFLLYATAVPYKFEGDISALRVIEATASGKLNYCIYSE